MFKKLVFLLALIASLTGFAAQKNAMSFDPPYWWAGMKDSSLQIQVYAPGVKNSEVALQPYPGVTLESVVRLDGSDNYLFLYLNVTPEAKPGKLKFKFTQGKRTSTQTYELRARREQRGAQGFTAADVLYMIMPDRFANGDSSNDLVSTMKFPVGAERDNLNRRHGGDLKGIADHLAYLDTLGVTAIWLNPVLENDMPGGSYHGYATTDYYKVDPRFGTNADYAALIDTLHNHGMKTVMDMIFNHSGSQHRWLLDPPSADWYNMADKYEITNHKLASLSDKYASDYDRNLTVDGWFVPDMPDLNQRNPHLLKYLIQNSIWWIEDAQIDGIRMDTYPYADRAAMAEWVDAVLAEYPGFNIVGECWFAEPAICASWQKGSVLAGDAGDSHLPVVMDFPLMIKSKGLAPYNEQTDPWNGLSKIYDHVGLDFIYADPMNLLRFLDNHDTERVILEVPENLDSWKQAITLLLTLPGIPQLYYGTELLMAGDRKLGDGNVRRDMPGGWKGDTVNAFTREGRTDLQNEAYDFLSTLLQWRKGSEAMAKGDMKHYHPSNGVYLYNRKAGNSEALIILNGQDNSLITDMSRYAEVLTPGREYRDVLTGRIIVPLAKNPADREYTFAPREVLVLEPLQ